MKSWLWIISMLVLSVVLPVGCNSKDSTPRPRTPPVAEPPKTPEPDLPPLAVPPDGAVAPISGDTPAVYGTDPNNGTILAVDTVAVRETAARRDKLDMVLARMNRDAGDRRIELVEISETAQGTVVLVDLVDAATNTYSGGWYDSFQGSSGGQDTQAFLVNTLLQPRYQAPWFDAVEFLYKGEPFGDMDHVSLKGRFYRIDSPESAEDSVGEWVRSTLKLADDDAITWAPLFRQDGNGYLPFFVSSSTSMVRRGVLEVLPGGLRVTVYQNDPCYCLGLTVQPTVLVPDRRPFLVVRFSPVTGSCVGYERVTLLRVGPDGFQEVWSGDTYAAQDGVATVADVTILDVDDDPESEIRLQGRRVQCADNCLCRDGKTLLEIDRIFQWSRETGRFVEG